jgi:protein-S-isoprenylcysteine O-methyltransferase Ste14
MLFIEALISFLALPFVAAGIIPCVLLFIDPWRGDLCYWGLPIMIFGLYILIWCVRVFYISGKGTLAPWSPPKHLVTIGLYRFCRNPMYIGVLTLVFGWAILTFSFLIAVYYIILLIGFHLWVILYEEPQLSKLFGTEWELYSSSVPRWIPKIR